VQFTVKARESQAPGALGYQLDYGDGTSDRNVVAQFCRAEPAPADEETWQLSHRYSSAGRYTATVTVSANCTSDRATTTLNLTAG